MRLQTKLISLLVVLIIGCEITVFTAVRRVAEELVGDLMLRYGQMISKYDTEKTLAPIANELRKAKELASEPAIVAWAKNPQLVDGYASAVSILEQYRWKFASNSFFIALKNNHTYYYNDNANQNNGNPFSYTLDPNSVGDQWFFDALKNVQPLHININPNKTLNVTRLWIDIQLRSEGEVLGVLGTGIEYETIMDDLFDTELKGIDTLFVNQQRIIQLYREAGVAREDLKENSFYQKKVIGELMESESDSDKIDHLLDSAMQGKELKAIVVHYKGERHLAVVSYIAELQWYEVTLINMNLILPASKFTTLYVIFGAAIVLVAIFLAAGIHHWVIRPIGLLESKTRTLSEHASSHLAIQFRDKPKDEMGLLMTHFEEMSEKIENFTLELEDKVAKRTEALERLASIDPLTELLNRRGMERNIQIELNHARRDHYQFGLLWLDVDHFKQINDSLGHDKGDEALQRISEAISSITRSYESASRWGGDEFLILIRTDSENTLYKLAERLRTEIRKIELSSDDETLALLLSVSIGGTIVSEFSTIKAALLNADSALYQAKHAGRNQSVIWPGASKSRPDKLSQTQ